jgi:hypothetical protein
MPFKPIVGNPSGTFNPLPVQYSVALENCLTELLSLFCLRVPKYEIFDRLDFHDLYTIKPFWVGDLLVTLGLKYKLVTLNFGWGS